MSKLKLYRVVLATESKLDEDERSNWSREAIGRAGYQVGDFYEVNGEYFMEIDDSISFHMDTGSVFVYASLAVTVEKLDWKFGEYDTFYECISLNKYAAALLEGETILSLSDDGFPGSYQTSKGTFLFMLTTEPVMIEGRTKEIYQRFKLSVQIGETEQEFARVNNVGEAIDACAHEMLNWKIRNVGEGLFWEKRGKLEPYETL